MLPSRGPAEHSTLGPDLSVLIPAFSVTDDRDSSTPWIGVPESKLVTVSSNTAEAESALVAEEAPTVYQGADRKCDLYEFGSTRPEPAKDSFLCSVSLVSNSTESTASLRS
jgi:hypothetical protein